jgi:hypothetical protein
MQSSIKRSFKAGDVVQHSRLGFGVVLEEWGAWVDVDDRGKALAINGAGIYETEFLNHDRRSASSNWLYLAIGGETAGQITRTHPCSLSTGFLFTAGPYAQRNHKPTLERYS